MIWRRSEKFQDELKQSLKDEWDLSFISLDITKKDNFDADVIFYNQMDHAYMPEKIKNKGMEVPFAVIQTKDQGFIKKQLEHL